MQGTAIFQLMDLCDGEGMFNYVTKVDRSKVINEAIRQYEPGLHKVADPALRPDKTIFVPSTIIDPLTNKPKITQDTAPVTRAPLAIQKYIISQKGSFARGNGVILKPSDENSPIYTRVSNNWIQNKTDFDLKEVGVRQMGETQCAIIFFGEKGKESFDDFRFRYKIVSPLKGDKLYPYFDDDTDDLIGFGREYKRGNDTMFDLYLMNEVGLCEIWKYKNKAPLEKTILGIDGAADTVVHDVIVTSYTKLPIIYWEQDAGECDDTKEIINELEIGFSDFLTSMGYTADPILFGKGKAMDLPAKGTAGKFIESNDPEGDLKFITPDNATESRDLQFKMLQKYIFSLNRAVLLDLETLKGLGAISGAALERYLIDAYMEATDRQQGSWGKGWQRAINWLVSQWAVLLGVQLKGFRIDAVFTKYSLQDELEKVTLAMTANGGKPVIDIKTSIAIADLVDDPQVTMDLIKQETDIPASGSETIVETLI